MLQEKQKVLINIPLQSAANKTMIKLNHRVAEIVSIDGDKCRINLDDEKNEWHKSLLAVIK